LTVAQNAPFVGPAATAILMFYATCQQCSQNMEVFQDLIKLVNRCDAWKSEIVKQKYDFEGTVANLSYEDLVEALINGQQWMARANNRLNKEKKSITTTLANLALSSSDNDKMNGHLAKIKECLERFVRCYLFH
jgi:uncharacterized protein YjgD (DUF1641 family)